MSVVRGGSGVGASGESRRRMEATTVGADVKIGTCTVPLPRGCADAPDFVRAKSWLVRGVIVVCVAG